MDELIAKIELNLTEQELVSVLVVAKAALDDPHMRFAVAQAAGLETIGDVYSLLHNVTEVLEA